MTLPVEFFSQYDKTVPVDWQPRICALSCLKMVLDFYERPGNEIETLIAEALALNGHDETYGWKHDSLVKLARNHGVSAYAQEFRSRLYQKDDATFIENPLELEIADFGWAKILASLKAKQPVIVSVLRQFKLEKTFHQVLLVGFETSKDGNTGVYYLDPEIKPEAESKPIFIGREEFLSGWRQLAIFVEAVRKVG